MSGLNVVWIVAAIAVAVTRAAVALNRRATQGSAAAATQRPAAATGSGDADLLSQAADLVIRTQFGSIHMVARKLGLSPAKASAVMDVLEANGIVGPHAGDQARVVLVRPADSAAVLRGLRTGRPLGRVRR
jgi:DNA segregation ATPase FtsK/SpoIIIE-like protein